MDLLFFYLQGVNLILNEVNTSVKYEKSSIKRETKETSINVEVNLTVLVSPRLIQALVFLDHMMEQIAKHSLIDIKLEAKGDLHIDLHHTTEDSGIAFGEALKKALGDKKELKGMQIATIPMDETLSRVSLDLSNRPYLVWKVKLAVEKLGEMDTELFKEWYHAFFTKCRYYFAC